MKATNFKKILQRVTGDLTGGWRMGLEILVSLDTVAEWRRKESVLLLLF